jgi:putative ABC transport system permease protein
MGVRMALGATKADILNLVLGSAMKLTGGGLVIGIVLSLGGVRLASGWISGMQGNRWLTVLAVSLLLLSVALFASYLPARRATRIEPSAALRGQ